VGTVQPCEVRCSVWKPARRTLLNAQPCLNAAALDVQPRNASKLQTFRLATASPSMEKRASRSSAERERSDGARRVEWAADLVARPRLTEKRRRSDSFGSDDVDDEDDPEKPLMRNQPPGKRSSFRLLSCCPSSLRISPAEAPPEKRARPVLAPEHPYYKQIDSARQAFLQRQHLGTWTNDNNTNVNAIAMEREDRLRARLYRSHDPRRWRLVPTSFVAASDDPAPASAAGDKSDDSDDASTAFDFALNDWSCAEVRDALSLCAPLLTTPCCQWQRDHAV
jgi:hypothetical protein